MVDDDGIKGCCQMEQTESRHLPSICCQQQIIVDLCYLRLSAMEFPVGGLSRWH